MPFDGKQLTETQQNCLELADYIERQPEGRFRMNSWDLPGCGTAGCIAGHGFALWSDLPRKGGKDVRYVPMNCAKKLGLNEDQATAMFLPNSMSDITKPMAVAALRRFALTGEIYFDPADA